MKYYTYEETPVGTILFVGEGKILQGLYWKSFKRAPKIGKDWVENKKAFEGHMKQLNEYFSGKRTSFDSDFVPEGTPFQKKVWKELLKIPFGTSRSYKDIAKAVGKPKAVRAVGTAIGSNPLCIIVPCHRVLTSAGELGGYAGGLESKKVLLTREGIKWGKKEE